MPDVSLAFPDSPGHWPRLARMDVLPHNNRLILTASHAFSIPRFPEQKAERISEGVAVSLPYAGNVFGPGIEPQTAAMTPPRHSGIDKQKTPEKAGF